MAKVKRNFTMLAFVGMWKEGYGTNVRTNAQGFFVVKGFRGPFFPIYEVGDRAFAFMPFVWYLTAMCFMMVLWGKFA